MAREIGFRKPTIALITKNEEGQYSTEKPTRLGRGIECKVNRKQDTDTWYSDDSIEEIVYGDCEIEVDLTINNISPEIQVLLYGGEIIKGVYTPRNGQPNEVAYMDEVLLSDGTYKKRCFYCGRFEKPSDDNKTKDKKPDSKGKQIKGKFYARQKDGLSEISYYTGLKGADEAIGKAWFESVPEKPISTT